MEEEAILMITDNIPKEALITTGEIKKDKEYYLWELVEHHVPKQKIACSFDFNKEMFEVDNDLYLNGVCYKKGRHSLRGCKTINEFYDKIKEKVATLETIGHKHIDGECLDGLL